MCRICFTADITNDAPTAPASLANFMHRNAKAVARWHATAHHRSAIRAHDYTVIRPTGRGKIQRPGAHVSLQLCRAAEVCETKRFRIDGPTSNENGQATSCPAVSVESGVNVDHQALPQ